MITPDPAHYQPDQTRLSRTAPAYRPFNSGTTRDQSARPKGDDLTPGYVQSLFMCLRLQFSLRKCCHSITRRRLNENLTWTLCCLRLFKSSRNYICPINSQSPPVFSSATYRRKRRIAAKRCGYCFGFCVELKDSPQ